MITHTPTFETLAEAPVKTTDIQVARQILDTYGYIDDPTMIWSGQKHLENANIQPILMQVNIDAVGTMLAQATKKATVKMLGTDTSGLLLPKSGDLFYIRYGLYNSDPSVSGYVYISEGFYLVDSIDCDYEAGSTTIIMYDQMWKAGKTKYSEAVPSTLITYPVTVQSFAAQIASLLNLTLDSGFSTLPNASYSIQQDLYSSISGATLQTAIQDIAGATGTTARVTDNTLIFSQYNISTESLGSSTLKTLKVGDTYGPITSVILGRVPQNDNIALFASTPTVNTVESINTSTDVLTITANLMSAGNMVYFTSTGTLPAPLVAKKNYYVYVVTSNTFKLTNTYTDAINGTNFIDLTTAGTGTITIAPITTKEIQINNNQIVDNDRQTLLPPLYNTLSGIDWTYVKSDTVGLGWHEVGDVIKFTQGTNTFHAFLSEVHLAFAGSVKENLLSTIPTVAAIDYQAAGGVLKTLYNTEIKVDKQAQDITSIVSEQSTFEGTTTTNFTEIYQNLTDILLTVQKSGGGNLILNSVGYATDTATDLDSVSFQKLTFWYYNHNNTYPLPTDGSDDGNSQYRISTYGTVTSYSSSESQNAGGISGQVVEINGNGLILEQYVPVAVNTPICFGVRVKKGLAQGGGTIILYNDHETYTITVANLTAYVWDELKLENITFTMPWVKVKITSASAVHWQFTDLRLIYGTTLQGWVQSASEILATNVQFSKLGMKIFDNVHDTETQVTYNEFSTRRRSDGKILFEADDSGVITNDLSIRGVTNYRDTTDTAVIRQITIPLSNSRSGIAFIKVS